RDVQFRMHAVAEPPNADLAHAAPAFDMAGRMLALADNLGADAVEQPAENRLAGLPNDPENHDRDEQADGGIGQRISQPDPESADQDGQAGQAVGARVVTVGDERGAADLFADLDAKNGDGFVAGESDETCRNDRP